MRYYEKPEIFSLQVQPLACYNSDSLHDSLRFTC